MCGLCFDGERLADSLLDDRMLAVMTMNVGYFLSVLAGVFLGTCLIATSKSEGSQYQDC